MAQANPHQKYHVLINWQTGRGKISIPVSLETAKHWKYTKEKVLT